MRVGLWALLAVLLGAFVAHFVLEDRGYVLVNFRGYVVEMSVPGLVLMLVALYLGVRGLAVLVRLPRSCAPTVAAPRAARRRNGRRGLMHLIEGDFARAERLLTRSPRSPLAGYLLAARAAQSQGAITRRDEWLKLAYDASPESRPAVLLARAELELDAGELDAAQSTLERLDELKPDHPGAVGLLARVLPRPRRRAGARSAAAEARASAHGRARARRARGRGAAGGARKPVPWREPARRDLARSREGLARVAAGDRAARALSRPARPRHEAERELRAALKKSWHRDLVLAYGEVHGADGTKQLKQAESWLKTYRGGSRRCC